MTDDTGPAPKMDNQAFGKPSAAETGGTVYGGPAPAQGSPSATGAAPVRTGATGGLSPRAIRSANWFFWIAGLSIVNLIISMNGGGVHFVVGLGVTHFIGAVGGVVAAGVIALFGFFARQGQKWAFLVGGVVYLLDGLLLLTYGDLFSAAFHGLVLFFIFRGFMEL